MLVLEGSLICSISIVRRLRSSSAQESFLIVPLHMHVTEILVSHGGHSPLWHGKVQLKSNSNSNISNFVCYLDAFSSMNEKGSLTNDHMS